MKSCLKCGNAIGESGKVYGYAGAWCHCADPNPDAYPPVTGFPEIRPHKKLSDYIADMHKTSTLPGKITELPSGTDLSKIAPGPIVRMEPTPPPITPARFVDWLRGYFAASGGTHTFTQADWKRIAGELAKVSP